MSQKIKLELTEKEHRTILYALRKLKSSYIKELDTVKEEFPPHLQTPRKIDILEKVVDLESFTGKIEEPILA